MGLYEDVCRGEGDVLICLRLLQGHCIGYLYGDLRLIMDTQKLACDLGIGCFW